MHKALWPIPPYWWEQPDVSAAVPGAAVLPQPCFCSLGVPAGVGPHSRFPGAGDQGLLCVWVQESGEPDPLSADRVLGLWCWERLHRFSLCHKCLLQGELLV